jgi:hypothetical protein
MPSWFYSTFGHILGFVAKGLFIWLSITLLAITLIVVVGTLQRILMRLKIRMAEVDGRLPLPLHDRRRRKSRQFFLRLTRRPLTAEDGLALEALNHAIDYLIQTYGLERFVGMPPGHRPAEFFAVQTLLECRAEMLNLRPPLPSFSYLLRRRLACVISTEHNRT